MKREFEKTQKSLLGRLASLTDAKDIFVYINYKEKISSVKHKFENVSTDDVKKIITTVSDKKYGNCKINNNYMDTAFFYYQFGKSYICFFLEKKMSAEDMLSFYDKLNLLSLELFDKLELLDVISGLETKISDNEELFMVRVFQSEEQLRRAKKINQVISEISAEQDFDKAVKIIIKELEDLYSFEGYTFNIVDNEKKTYSYYSYHFPFDMNENIKGLIEKEYPLTSKGGRVAQAITENRHFYFYNVNLNDVDLELNKEAVKVFKIKSALIIPFGPGDEVFGVLMMLGHTRNLKLSDEDIKMIRNFLNQIANVFKNSFLYTTIERKRKELEKIHKVINAINLSRNFDEILDVVIKELKELYYFESYLLALVDDKRETYRYYSAHLPDADAGKLDEVLNNDYPLDKRGGRIADAIIRNEMYYFKDVPALKIRDGINKYAADIFNPKSFLIIPLESYSEVFGVITLSTRNKTLDLTEEDIAYIKGFFKQLANAFKTIFFSRLAMEKKSELEKINEFIRKVTSSLNIDDVLSFIISYLKERYNFEGHLIALENENKNIGLEVSRIKLEAKEKKVSKKELGTKLVNGIVKDSFEKNRVLYINNANTELLPPRYANELKNTGICSIICSPINVDNRPIGVLSFFTFNKNNMDLGDKQRESLVQFADYISAAIKNSILYNKVQTQKIEIEKEKDFTSSILAYSPIAIITTDRQGYLKLANPSFANFTKMSDEEITGINIEDIPFIRDNNIHSIIKPAYSGMGVNVEKVNAVNPSNKNNYIMSILATPIFSGDKISNVLILFIDNSEIIKKEVELEKRNKIMEKDLFLAKRIQENILPKKNPDFKGVKFFSTYIPVDQLGGDFFDYITIDDDNIGILICDVSGHGVSAAFITSMIKSSTDMSKKQLLSPALFLKRLKKRMLPLLKDKYFTAFYGVIKNKDKCLIYSNAAHVPQLIYRKDCSVEELYMPSYFIGLFEDEKGDFEEKTVGLSTGDKIIFYTDGLIDTLRTAEDASQSAMIGKLTKIVCSKNYKNPESLVKNIIDEAKKSSTSFKDDIALIVSEIKWEE
jgi:sigma-B regulation protein RsbU (phosphoserine phosphatase)